MSEQLELFDVKGHSRLTLREAFDLFWKYYFSIKASSPKYMGSRKRLVKAMGEKYIDSITDYDFVTFRENQLSTLSAWTTFTDHTLMTLLYKTLRQWKRRQAVYGDYEFKCLTLPRENPTDGVKKLKGEPRRVTVTPGQFARLMEHSTERLKEVLIFAIDNAIRPGDLKKLKPSNFNLNDKAVYLRQGKTKRDIRLPLSPRQLKIASRAIYGRFPFLLDMTNIRKEFEAARKKARLPWLQFRDLRRTNLNEVVNWSGRAWDAKEMAGHAYQRTTEEFYLVGGGVDLRPHVKHIAKKFAERC